MRKTLTFQIVPKQYETLRQLAASNFNSVGAEVRRAVDDYLRKHQPTGPHEREGRRYA